jgi:hypothetical protein
LGQTDYLVDLPSVLSWLAPQLDRVIASYNPAPPSNTAAKRLQIIAAQLSSGWVNNFTEIEIVTTFTNAASSSQEFARASGERIFVFSRGS